MNKILLTGIVSTLFLVCSSYSLSIFAEETPSPKHMNPVTEMGGEFELWITMAHWTGALATIMLAIYLIKTFTQMSTSNKVAFLESEYRLRPWIAPIGSIKKMEKSINDDHQFDVTIKNYGELAASAVTAKFVKGTEPLTRESFQSNNVDSYGLGPVMPTMEKPCWFFIDSETWKKVDSGLQPLYTGLYFEYSHAGKKSGYGMLSEYNPSTKNFIHRDMWIDDE